MSEYIKKSDLLILINDELYGDSYTPEGTAISDAREDLLDKLESLETYSIETE